MWGIKGGNGRDGGMRNWPSRPSDRRHQRVMAAHGRGSERAEKRAQRRPHARAHPEI